MSGKKEKVIFERNGYRPALIETSSASSAFHDPSLTTSYFIKSNSRCVYKGIIVLKLPSLYVIKYNNGHSVSASDFVLFCALYLRVVGVWRVVAPVVICFPVECSLVAFARLCSYRSKSVPPPQTENVQRGEEVRLNLVFDFQKNLEYVD